jgi:hypothetical protein
MTPYLGWIANAVIGVGLVSLSPRRRWPFACMLLGESLWVFHAIGNRQHDLAAICAVFAAIALKNSLTWNKEPKA